LHAQRRRTKAWLVAGVASLLTTASLAVPTAGMADQSGGVTLPPPSPPQPTQPGGAPITGVPVPPVPGAVAKLSADGRTAIPPAAAPQVVKLAIYAANKITRKPYRYGGGHRSFKDSAYDCSGSVSYALHGAGLVATPLDSRDFMRWGLKGPGQWITVFTNPGHAYTVIAGLRFDTSGSGESGPRWRVAARSSRGYRSRHFLGL
jgi:cell wall-associated NlpC family hydrolase